MSETVMIDKKGRLVLPKKVREEARIKANTRLVAKALGPGSVELYDPEVVLARAREIGAKKLAGWKEEDHEASAYLLKLVREENETR